MLFLTAVMAGKLARMIKIPRVAGYLVGGLIVGPHILGIVNADSVRTMVPVTEFALALIMFDIGTNFDFKRFGERGRRLLPLIIGDIGITFTLVFSAVLLSSKSTTTALLLGILAIATAPATTLLVLKEYEAEGLVTDTLITLVGINNFVCIVAFEFALVSLNTGEIFLETAAALGNSALIIAASIGIAGAGGVIVSYLEQKVSGPERLILFLGIVAAIYGVCVHFNLPYMLVFLVMGAAVENTSEFAEEIIGELDRVGWPLYVLFFSIAGAKLHIDRLTTIGLIGLVYLLSRTAGKIGGVTLMTRFAKEFTGSAKTVGWGMLSQAGVAIGLAMATAKKFPQAGAEIETVIVSTIVFFELVGSPLVRLAVVSAGEVKVIALINRPSDYRYHLSLRRMGRRLLVKCGLSASHHPGSLEQIRVRHVMRKNVRTIPLAATFPEILAFISRSRQHNFPVTNTDSFYEGLISYPEIREVLYDPNLARIMIAKDFVRYKDARISPDESLDGALLKFTELNLDCIPVVEDDSGRLVGILDQREVLSLCGKKGTVMPTQGDYEAGK